MNTKCEHRKFVSQVNVFRLCDYEDGPITGYHVDVNIKCDECGVAFRFRGLPPGHHHSEPRVSIDGTTLRAPLEPAYVTEIMGHPLVAGNA